MYSASTPERWQHAIIRIELPMSSCEFTSIPPLSNIHCSNINKARMIKERGEKGQERREVKTKDTSSSGSGRKCDRSAAWRSLRSR